MLPDAIIVSRFREADQQHWEAVEFPAPEKSSFTHLRLPHCLEGSTNDDTKSVLQLRRPRQKLPGLPTESESTASPDSGNRGTITCSSRADAVGSGWEAGHGRSPS